MKRNSCFAYSVIAIAFTAASARAGEAQASYETLYSFQGSPDGANPQGGVVISRNGTLFGTTYSGGTSGSGTIFELTPALSTPWKETVLHNFSGGDGASPKSGLVFGSTGALYGTTSSGGSGMGTVFELAPPTTPGGTWTETLLHNFSFYNPIPQGPLLIGSNGALYGTTMGLVFISSGTTFALAPPATPGGSWSEFILYVFNQYAPTFAGLASQGGSLFGTQYYAGNCFCKVDGCGSVYELTPPATPGSAWTETTIYSFATTSEGLGPEAAPTAGPSGVLYGRTTYGGSGACSANGGAEPGCGTVFELTPPAAPGGTWTEAVIHSFSGVNGDGIYPFDSVVVGKNGALYGTTPHGGSATCGCGTVFELTPPTTPGGAWTETVLHSFTGLNGDGSDPLAGLALSPSGVLFGTTYMGGSAGQGTVFAIRP